MSDSPGAGSNEKSIAVSRVIDAPADVIFEILATPARHSEIDGSGTVQNTRLNGPARLELGSRFGMDMKFGPLPYRISNEVVAFEEDRVIAWRHFGHHVWRYDLEPQDDGRTLVTESFDWGVSRFPPLYEWMKYPEQHEQNMARTLERLEAVLTDQG